VAKWVLDRVFALMNPFVSRENQIENKKTIICNLLWLWFVICYGFGEGVNNVLVAFFKVFFCYWVLAFAGFLTH
jgi:hypothetical protein